LIDASNAFAAPSGFKLARVNSFKPIPEARVIIPSVALTIRLTQPNYHSRPCRSAKNRPNLSGVVNNTCRPIPVVANDDFLSQSDALACAGAAFIVGDGILAHQHPLGLPLWHARYNSHFLPQIFCHQ
jgi:hypothetical protein